MTSKNTTSKVTDRCGSAAIPGLETPLADRREDPFAAALGTSNDRAWTCSPTTTQTRFRPGLNNPCGFVAHSGRIDAESACFAKDAREEYNESQSPWARSPAGPVGVVADTLVGGAAARLWRCVAARAGERAVTSRNGEQYLIRALEDPEVLFSESVLDDPRPLYRQLRREAPLWRLPDGVTFLVCDPELIGEIAARAEDFSSNLVSMIRRGADGGLVAQDMLPYRDPNHVLAVADPPDHTRQRKILQSTLSVSRVARLEPFVRELTDKCLQPMLRAGRGDVVSGVAEIVPAATICRLLGLPIEETGKLIPQVISVGALLDGLVDDDGMLQAAEAAVRLSEYAAAHLERQAGVAEDQRAGIFNAVIKAREQGEISTTEIVGILIQFFTAGTETTQSLIATTVERLARVPQEQTRLRENVDAIPAALEEVLRDDGPFQFHYRWTPAATTLAGTRIPAGSRLLLMWAAANQPPKTTDKARDADRGDSTRAISDATSGTGRGSAHLAFGRGIHFCIGAALARMEARAVIETLLASTRSFTLDPSSPPRRRPSIMLRRHAYLPVLFERG